MGLLSGKTGVIMGVANSRSIAAGISKVLSDEGAELAFSYFPDDTGKMETRVKRVVDAWSPKILHPCDVNDDASVESFFAEVEKTYGQIDFLVHSVAFAPLEDIRCKTLEASRAGFLTAMESSVYSLIATTRAASRLLKKGGSVVTLSYYGAEKVIPGYNLMGLAKAALENAVMYLAHDLGSKDVRVNSISAGAIKTLASSAIGDFKKMLELGASTAPLGRNVTAEDVGKTAAYLLSELSTGVTGENIHVDGGYHIMGSPDVK